jgi:tetratricopeptide (TPR) repeat protein
LLILLLLLFATDPSQVSGLLQRGLIALQHGQLTAARQSLEEAVALDPRNPFAFVSLAETYFRLKQPRRAASAAAAAEKLGSANPVVSHALAMYYSEAGDFARAASLEQQFAMSKKADPGALDRAAGLYLNAGDGQRSLALARQAVADHPSALAEDVLGRALISTGQPDEGTRHLATAFHSDPANAQICFDYVQALLHYQDFTRAAAALEQCLKAHPDNAQLTLALGVSRYGQRRFEDAIAAFLRTIQLDPSIDKPYLFLGRVLDQAGPRLGSIIAVYRRLEAQNPKNPEAKLLLAKALTAAGAGGREPEELLHHSIALNQTDWESHYELGLIFEKNHDYKQAVAELSRAAALSPKQPLPHYHLARDYDRLGDPDRAKSERDIHQRLNVPSAGAGMSAQVP